MYLSELRIWKGALKGDERRITHFDEHGNAIMVDVGEQDATIREAVARGMICMSRACFDAVIDGMSYHQSYEGVHRFYHS